MQHFVVYLNIWKYLAEYIFILGYLEPFLESVFFINVFESEWNNNKSWTIVNECRLMNVCMVEYMYIWIFTNTVLIKKYKASSLSCDKIVRQIRRWLVTFSLVTEEILK